MLASNNNVNNLQPVTPGIKNFKTPSRKKALAEKNNNTTLRSAVPKTVSKNVLKDCSNIILNKESLLKTNTKGKVKPMTSARKTSVKPSLQSTTITQPKVPVYVDNDANTEEQKLKQKDKEFDEDFEPEYCPPSTYDIRTFP